MKNKKGKLLVIDGADGSGKTTQRDLLLKSLRKQNHDVRTMHFPAYENFFGGFIGECLTDKKYNFVAVHPKIVSALYAADRWESSLKIKDWLAQGCTVVLDRYVSANQIHQGGKIKNLKQRTQFIKWLDTMEHEIFGIPKPDLIIYLSLPVSFIEQLIKKRNATSVRTYGNRKTDVHESDLNFQKNSRQSALWLSKKLPNFIKIDCAPKKVLLPPDKIHETVCFAVAKIVKK